MKCAECLELVLVANLGDANEHMRLDDEGEDRTREFRAHVASCDHCIRTVQYLRDAQARLSSSLELTTPVQTADAISAIAFHRRRTRRLSQRIVLPILAVVLIVASALLVGRFTPALKRYTAPPPEVETQTFSLQCLSADQATSLLRPYLPRPQNPMWQAEAFDVRPVGGGIRAVTVRAPPSTLVQVPALLERFEQDPQADCRVK